MSPNCQYDPDMCTLPIDATLYDSGEAVTYDIVYDAPGTVLRDKKEQNLVEVTVNKVV